MRRKLIYKRRREIKKSLEKITQSETLKFVLFINRLNLSGRDGRGMWHEVESSEKIKKY